MSLIFYSFEFALREIQFARPFHLTLNQYLWDLSNEGNE